jgi:hypothetical protein
VLHWLGVLPLQLKSPQPWEFAGQVPLPVQVSANVSTQLSPLPSQEQPSVEQLVLALA